MILQTIATEGNFKERLNKYEPRNISRIYYMLNNMDP